MQEVWVQKSERLIADIKAKKVLCMHMYMLVYLYVCASLIAGLNAIDDVT